ncbi:protein kinase domain-containing protein [Sinosporangium siamense]|uniref:protein kinase domain-containing protein n=1 Tax=Sinosporangium siamense TaxID=1367973 RepID=UPI0023B20987|nr:protein kinase [Sinosporangium siamense]
MPAVYDCGTRDDRLYLVMQRVEGVSVSTVLDEAEIPVAWAAVVGTPEYMAPEQVADGTVGPRSDLYTLGVVLDEMLTGENQFLGGTPLASMDNHLELPPRPLRRRRRDVPQDLERLVLWLLDKNPERRPANATVVFNRLIAFCQEIPSFPGYVVTSSPHAIRMYGKVLGMIDGSAARGSR